MREYTVAKIKHIVYDSIDECTPNITPLKGIAPIGSVPL